MHRIERVSELLKEEISRIIQFDVKDPKVKDVVITSIEVTRDLSQAKVFFTSYNKENLKYIHRGLMSSAGFIRHQLQKAVHLKKTPSKLMFFIDDSSEYGSRIDEVLREIIKEDDERDS
ncbi:ribosome-binding factor A [Geovibrio sp. ADMFC3]|nr:30S ribosome-binding factor RbfA [Deferribacteraceae bacterium]